MRQYTYSGVVLSGVLFSRMDIVRGILFRGILLRGFHGGIGGYCPGGVFLRRILSGVLSGDIVRGIVQLAFSHMSFCTNS